MENFAIFIESNWFYIVIAFWGVAALANKGKRNELKDRLADIVTKPAILANGDESTNPIYSTEKLEQVSKDVADRLITPIDGSSQNLKAWINSKRQAITSDDKPWKTFGYLLLLIMLALFFYADAIAIANTLEAINLLEQVPESLTRYELAVALGSFFTVVAGGLVANELFGKSEFTDWDEQHGLWKSIAAVITLFLIVSGLLVVIALGLARYRLLVTLPATTDSQLEQFVNITILVLVPVNAILATILIHREGIKGFQVVFLIAADFFAAIIYFWLYIVRIIGAMGVFGLDLIVRGMIALLFLLAFLFFTPLDTIAAAISAPFSKTSENK